MIRAGLFRRPRPALAGRGFDMKEYELVRNGITFTVLMDEKTAQERKLKPVQRKGAAPQNKAKAPQNKFARDVAKPSDK